MERNEDSPTRLTRQAKFYQSLENYVKAILKNGGVVVFGVFTQPYCKVEENEDIVNLYNKLLSDCDLTVGNHHTRLKVWWITDHLTN